MWGYFHWECKFKDLSNNIGILAIQVVLCQINIFCHQLKFIYSEKATKFCEISAIDLTITTWIKFTMEILQKFVPSQTMWTLTQNTDFFRFTNNYTNRSEIQSTTLQFLNFRKICFNQSSNILFSSSNNQFYESRISISPI